MITTIGIIGSIASLIGLPLGYYWFKKSRYDKRVEIKDKIIRTIKSFYGQDQKLTFDQLESIIRDKLSRAGFNESLISTQEILDALTTNIIEEPLLYPKVKKEILFDLKRLETSQKINKLLTYNQKYLGSGKKGTDVGEVANEIRKVSFEDPYYAEKLMNEKFKIEFNKSSFAISPSTYSFLYISLIFIGGLLSIIVLFTVIDKIDNRHLGNLILVGVSILIGILSSLIYDMISRKFSRNETKKEFGEIEDIEYIEISNKE